MHLETGFRIFQFIFVALFLIWRPFGIFVFFTRTQNKKIKNF